MIINIEIEKCKEGENIGAPRLKLKYAPSEKAPFKEYVCTLSAQGSNQTSEASIESLSSFAENLKALKGDFNHLPPDQYLLILPNPESAEEPLQLMIKRDGSICVQHANTPVDLTLKSFKNIDCPNAVCLQSINLTAPTITVSNHLMATENACFKANQLTNSGYIESSKDLDLKLIVLKNEGAILANRINGAFAKRCKTETSAVETTLENKGIIIGLDQLHLNVPGKVINQPDAAIIANKDFKLQTGIFENHAQVTVKGSMTVVTQQKFHNDNASVVFAQNISVIGGKFLNEGAIVSKGRLSVVSDYSLVNRSSAKLITEEELLLCSKSKGIKIGGTVAAEKSIKIIATNQNIVLPNAKIYCTKDIELASPTEVNNSGELRAGANVQILSGIVNNNAVAKVIASELLSITAGQHLTNAGELSGCQSVLATALHSVHNLATGNIHSVLGNVELKTFGEVMNAGIARAHTTLAITAASLTNAAMTGELHSLDILRANILNALKNNGKIKAEHLRLTSQTLDNAAEAILKAGKQLMLTVRDNFHNAGNTTSEGTLEIDATVVQNMETGQIKAEGNLNIFVRELFSNQGLLKSGNAVIIEAAHFIHNLMHGKMEALGSVMLKAGGQFLNQGSVFSQQSVDIQVLVCLRKYHDKEIDPPEAFAVLDELYSDPTITHTLDPESVINARLILDHYKNGIIKHA
ncbi:MAG TPA: hypothetical protein VGU44_05265, partial [Gammaproteobacteria bacterium]|nr:hypothetical protein [Gammaproteobacteria bacterium]